MNEDRITYFAETDARNRRVKFGIKAKDRTRHVYVIGKTGMGKSTMLENMAVQDIQNGEGMCFIDPHGKTADLLLEYVPKERIRDVIHIAPFDLEYPISFNVLESVDRDKRHLVSSGLMSTFKKIWEDAWSARMEYILTNTLLALLEYPGATLLGVNRMLSDKEYRKDVVAHIQDPSVKAFWVKEFANYTERQAAEAVPAIQNKVGQFTANPLIRNMIGQAKSTFDFRKAMDERKIVIINLSKGKIGDENMKLLGGLLVTKIYLAAMSRADVPDRVMKIMPNFYLFVDEFQNFANASFADILSEARKYKLNLTIAHQYIEQMDEIVRPAVFGNVGTMIAFRVGATDGEILEKEFAPVFVLEDLVNLGFAQIYLKLMIDGLSSQPFSATTLPPIAHPDLSFVKDIIASSREQYSKSRAAVEEDIIKFHEPTPKPSAGIKGPASSAAQAPRPVSGSSATNLNPSSAPAGAVKLEPQMSAVKDLRPNEIRPNDSRAQQPKEHKPFKDLLTKVMQGKPQQQQQEPIKPAPSAPPMPPVSPVQSSVPPVQPIQPPTPPIQASNPNEPIKPEPRPQPKPDVPKVEIKVEVKPQPPKMPEPIKPEPSKFESLSNLAPKQQPPRVQPVQPKADPKIPQPKNINDLKNALAAAMSKGKAEGPKVDSEKPEPPKVITNNTPQPKEVPEEVLKNVLKVE